MRQEKGYNLHRLLILGNSTPYSLLDGWKEVLFITMNKGRSAASRCVLFALCRKGYLICNPSETSLHNFYTKLLFSHGRYFYFRSRHLLARCCSWALHLPRHWHLPSPCCQGWILFRHTFVVGVSHLWHHLLLGLLDQSLLVFWDIAYILGKLNINKWRTRLASSPFLFLVKIVGDMKIILLTDCLYDIISPVKWRLRDLKNG